MSGPYCNTCRFYEEYFRQKPETAEGECTDPTKRIIDARTSDPVSGYPIVRGNQHTCRNHRTFEEKSP